jgi:serine/threonine protein kinase/cytochrome c-type biogenesis protein CcmH/NrfG
MINAREREIEAFLEIPAWKQVAHRLASTRWWGDAAEEADHEPQLQPGTRLGPYEIVCFIAAGGMGEVYAGRDTRLDRRVAVKRLRAEWAADPERLRLFEQEARSGAALTHGNVLTVYDVGKHDGCPYLVTEHLEGETLRGRLDRGPVGTSEALDIAVQLARALAAVHAHGLVHGDVKPQNILLTTDGRVKLLDFGLARLARPESGDGAGRSPQRAEAIARVRGTIGYMAPEQLTEGAFTTRVDVFSFGCVVYEMLTGSRAFGGATAAQTYGAITAPEQVAACYPERIPRALRDLVNRCLEKDPDLRSSSMDELATALRLARRRAAHVRRFGLLIPFAGVVAALTLAPLAIDQNSREPAASRWERSPAYDEYVRGFALSRSLRGGPEVLAAARAHYDAALQQEAGYPLALAGLADLEIVGFVRGFDTSEECVARAEALAQRALATAPDSAEAHYVYASVLGWGRKDFEGAVRAFERGLRLKPTGRAWAGLAWALASLEPPRSREAEYAAREGLRREPAYEYSYFQLARALRQQGRDDEAILALEDALRIEPLFAGGYTLLARIHLDRGDPRRALAVLDAASAHAVEDQSRPAERAVGPQARQAYGSAAHAALGQRDLALAELEAALGRGYSDPEFLEGPAFDCVRGDRRFTDLIAKYR